MDSAFVKKHHILSNATNTKADELKSNLSQK